MNSTNSRQSTVSLTDWQRAFIDFCLHKNVLQFGNFTLKSGRQSPYFFNAGHFDDGQSQQKIGEIYARTLIESNLPFNMIFGPAYKGIPLATSTSYALSAAFDRNVPFAFNRKEVKDHGEGGQIVGAKLSGDVVLVDDVITAGTAIRETLSLLEGYPEAKLVAAVVLIDRQEKLEGSDYSAIQALEKEFNLQILPAIRLDQIIEHIREMPEFAEHLPQIEQYRQKYGIE
ncbi:orotate phosphoribosyltransferase [Reinekea blandensis]|uniref:Orotate phosphoribosyltransferase n=1 Tax=Reinekea blandensis MED297 TaxID=314283 RepID=A4B9E6_9GAMM|nr:orotate phosphoribosyltransferase [Reinekea blandensis]EAR11247.1 orotate phosphoribosyltransferase [Reinekea sp. MED297] [Reinekea blandensis MED297]